MFLFKGLTGSKGHNKSKSDKYHVQKVKLGSGTFGTVWRAINRDTKEVVAMKAIDLVACKNRGMSEKDWQREIDMLRESKGCENITQLLDTFQDQRTLYVALEYCAGGDFADKLKERGKDLQEWEACTWMRHICSAIYFLHVRNIIHRDIKPENFLLGASSSDDELEVVKLSDFGLAEKLDDPSMILTKKCGTPAYMAPEQHTLQANDPSKGYGFPVDVWSAGVTMWVLLHGGTHPFVVNSRLRVQDLMMGKPAFPKNGFFSRCKWSKSAQGLCHAMTNPDVYERPLISEVLYDEWFTDKLCESPQRVSSPKNTGGSSTGQADDLIRQNEILQEELENVKSGKNEDKQKIQALERQISESTNSFLPISSWVKNLHANITDVLNDAGFGGSSSSSASPTTTSGSRSVDPLRPTDVGVGVDILTLLVSGTKVVYISPDGIVNAVVKSFNRDDLTYNLDACARVPALCITATADEQSRWPDGVSVTTNYFNQGGIPSLIHGRICAFDAKTKSYEIDDRKARIIYHQIPSHTIHPRVQKLGALSTGNLPANLEITPRQEILPSAPHLQSPPPPPSKLGRRRKQDSGATGTFRCCFKRRKPD